jgi:hypothetical protein
MLMLLSYFGRYGIIFMGMCIYKSCHGNAVKVFGALCNNTYECFYKLCHGNAIKVFWALWDNIYDFACLLV